MGGLTPTITRHPSFPQKIERKEKKINRRDYDRGGLRLGEKKVKWEFKEQHCILCQKEGNIAPSSV